MKIEIIEKLKRFLEQHSPLNNESETVYLMVELRKIVDRERKEKVLDKYPLVRFYADWVVHTQKDRITNQMKAIMNKIDSLLDPYPKKGDVRFLLMPEFRRELMELFREYNLENKSISDDYSWLKFVPILANVLANQPIINPTKNISSFRYEPMEDSGIMATIDFIDIRGSITLGLVP